MKVSRKLFIAIASFIVAMCLVFTFVTQFVIKDILDLMVEGSRKNEVEALTDLFVDYYKRNGGSWEGVRQLQVSDAGGNSHQESSCLLLTPEGKRLYLTGTADEQHIKLFGIRKPIQVDGKATAFMYYHDPEVDFLSKLRLGVRDSTTFLLFAGAIVFILISLLVAYWLSKRLTAPLRLLIPAIDRLGRGELGIQAPVVSQDEYGKTAQAFNEMSKQLQSAEEVRRSLVADVAHELRTPLTILRGQLDLVQQSNHPVPPERLLPLQDELIRLSRLVDDLHQLSLAEAKKLPLEKKPTDISGLLQRIIDRISPDAERKGVEISLISSPGTPPVHIDPNRMTQVFLNLLVNALRYTPPGGAVRIATALIKAQHNEKNHLQITVADTGIGIESDHLPFLFNRFYRTDEARTRNRGGSGLGLAIAKEFILAHNGRIDVKSKPGQGTTFIIELPFT